MKITEPMYECYENIIGLDDSDCECFLEGRPDDYDTSLSGLYLSSLAPVSSLIADCSETIWEKLKSSVEDAINLFVADTNALLENKHELKRKPVYGSVIGQIKSKYQYDNSKNYGLIRIACCPIRGGVAKLNAIGTAFSQAGVIQMELHNNVDGLLETYDLTTGSKKVINDINIELPLYSKYVDVLEYYLVFEFDENNKPQDTKIDCGCGSYAPKFDTRNPYYVSTVSRKNMEWGSFCMVGSMEINSLTEIDDLPTTMRDAMMGIFLDMDFTCKVDEVLCEGSLDFKGNPLAMSMALAILYKAGTIVGDKVMRSESLSRSNMIDSDMWHEDILVWQEKYNDQVKYIMSRIDYQSNDCFTCRDLVGMTRQGLFS